MPQFLEVGCLGEMFCLIEKKGDLAEIQIVAAKMNPGIAHVPEHGHHFGPAQ